MKHFPGIYQIRNLINNHLYIGQTQDLSAREDNHFTKLKYGKHHTPHLQAAYNKYGKDNFIFEPLVYCEIDELDRIEQAIIDKFNPEYNSLKIIGPGLRGYRFSDDAKKKISLAQKGRFFSDETRKRMSDAKKGKPLSPKAQVNRHKFEKGHKINNGRKLNQEQRERLRSYRLGKPLTDEHKRKIGAANRCNGYLRLGENNPRNRFTAEIVLEIREKFASGNYTYIQLARNYDTSSSQIQSICKRNTWKHI